MQKIRLLLLYLYLISDFIESLFFIVISEFPYFPVFQFVGCKTLFRFIVIMSTDRRAPSMLQTTDCSSARKRRNPGESSYPHGKRKQEQCLSIIEDAVDRKEGTSILSIIKELRKTYHIPIRTLYSWWNHVEQWGEYPFETRERKKQLQRLRGKIRLTRLEIFRIVHSKISFTNKRNRGLVALIFDFCDYCEFSCISHRILREMRNYSHMKLRYAVQCDGNLLAFNIYVGNP